MISKLGKYIPLIFLIICIFIFIDSLISFQELSIIKNDQQWVTHTYQTIHQANTIFRDIILSETHVEDFLLTNDAVYIHEYTASWKNIQNGIKNLTSLTSDNQSEKDRAKVLGNDINYRKSIFDKTLSINISQGTQAAQTYIATGVGRNSMAKIQTETKAIQQSEMQLLNQRENQFSLSTNYMYATIFGSAILNILLLLFTYIVVTREFEKRTQLEQKKNEFISLASHELKTPITSLSIYTEMLIKKMTPKTEKNIKSILFKMKNEVSEVKNLINDLLDATRIQLGKLDLQKENFDLTGLVQQTIEDIQLTTKKHKIFLRTDKNVQIYADRQRIWQILTNLLNNAIKYSPKGGTIRVSIIKERTRALIKVQDQGMGISKNSIPFIFDRYFREEGDNQKRIAGLGLGLYLSKEILDLHNGRIWVKSIEGKGTTFFCTLPLPRKKEYRK